MAPSCAVGSSAGDATASDVVIVGAGIVGLFAAHELLKQHLSVTLVERKGLCAGATGAGQGYLWMAHRTAGTVGWTLAARSMALWDRLTAGDEAFRTAIERQDCGSLLVSTCPNESASLSERQLALNSMGLKATYVDGRRLEALEPGLRLPKGGAALLVPADSQINGRAAAHALLECCRQFPHFTCLMDTPVSRIELAAGASGADGNGGHVVVTPGQRHLARKALVLAAGVWTGGMLAGATGDPGWEALLQPRRGHLLEMPAPEGMPRVAHGMMEMSYTKHYATSSASSSSGAAAAAPHASPDVDITFTATTSASGTLLLGSSREFSGWDTTPSPAIVSSILQRAALFLPGLGPAAAAAAAGAAAGAATMQAAIEAGGAPLQGLSVRVGLRPYAVGGLPLVGPVKDAPGLFVAAGHEGSGLCMGPATGELLVRHIRKHATGAGAGAGANTPSAGGSDSLDTRSFDDLLPDVRRREAKAGK